MKLTYRGINYQARKEIQPDLSNNAIEKCDRHLSRQVEANKVIQVTPIHYYTYRGVSYTKNLIVDPHAKLLLDIERQ